MENNLHTIFEYIKYILEVKKNGTLSESEEKKISEIESDILTLTFQSPINSKDYIYTRLDIKKLSIMFSNFMGINISIELGNQMDISSNYYDFYVKLFGSFIEKNGKHSLENMMLEFDIPEKKNIYDVNIKLLQKIIKFVIDEFYQKLSYINSKNGKNKFDTNFQNIIGLQKFNYFDLYLFYFIIAFVSGKIENFESHLFICRILSYIRKLLSAFVDLANTDNNFKEKKHISISQEYYKKNSDIVFHIKKNGLTKKEDKLEVFNFKNFEPIFIFLGEKKLKQYSFPVEYGNNFHLKLLESLSYNNKEMDEIYTMWFPNNIIISPDSKSFKEIFKEKTNKETILYKFINIINDHTKENEILKNNIKKYVRNPVDFKPQYSRETSTYYSKIDDQNIISYNFINNDLEKIMNKINTEYKIVLMGDISKNFDNKDFLLI